MSLRYGKHPRAASTWGNSRAATAPIGLTQGHWAGWPPIRTRRCPLRLRGVGTRRPTSRRSSPSTESLDRAGKGALLRWEGLYTSLISAWREQRDQGALEVLGSPPAARAPMSPIVSSLGCGGRTSGWPRSWTEERMGAAVEAAVAALVPLVGTRAACAAVGRARATHYRHHRVRPCNPAAGPATARRAQTAAAGADGR
jgi:hypothetical protein